jgi:hypothetical protein
VNGSTQRDYIPKENAASPTVINDSVMITSAVDAHEGRCVVTCDIPQAFLYTDLDEEVIMLLRGQLADLMVQVDPELYDVSYCVQEDCRGQTGTIMSLGRGAPMSFSWKQKLNVRSSCEGELVGIDDVLPHILWSKYFIEAQGYTVEQNIMYQDNKSTILLANNGRWSSSKRTKHIKSRYFLLRTRFSRGT